MKSVYARHWMNAVEIRAAIDPVSAKYQWHMCECVCRLRISEIFDIIVDFPDSTHALNDLKVSTSSTYCLCELITPWIGMLISDWIQV